MAKIPFWTEDPESWDTCILGGEILPGIADVTFEKDREFDVKKSSGSDGVVLQDLGAKAATGTIVLTVWAPEQWDDWQRIRPNIEPSKPGALKSPLTIVHPSAAAAGVDVIVVTHLSESMPRKGGSMRIKMECLQWFPQPKPVQAKKEPDIAARKAQDPGNVFLTPGEGLAGLSNPDGSPMDLGGPGGSGLSQREMDVRDARQAEEELAEAQRNAPPDSMFGAFGFGSTDPGTATGQGS
jgi:hypothetical protein